MHGASTRLESAYAFPEQEASNYRAGFETTRVGAAFSVTWKGAGRQLLQSCCPRFYQELLGSGYWQRIRACASATYAHLRTTILGQLNIITAPHLDVRCWHAKASHLCSSTGTLSVSLKIQRPFKLPLMLSEC